MKIHEVSYIAEDDLTKHIFFTSKSNAVKKFNELKKLHDGKVYVDEFWDENNVVKQLFHIHTFECEISKDGIISMLNKYFKETQ